MSRLELGGLVPWSVRDDVVIVAMDLNSIPDELRAFIEEGFAAGRSLDELASDAPRLLR